MDFFATNTEIAATDVRHWARQAISGWFTGHDDGFDEQRFQRYAVRRDRDGSYQFTDLVTKRMRRFEVAVVVVERP